MRKYFVLAWLLFPILVLTYHFTAGQKQLKRMDAAAHVRKIRTLERESRWEQVIQEYETLKGELPAEEDPVVFDEIALAQSRALLESGLLVEGIKESTDLLRSVSETHGPNASITRRIRETVGRGHYLATVVLRSDPSVPEKVWRRHADLARQQFRYLVENRGVGTGGRGRRSFLPSGAAAVSDPSEAGGSGDGAGSGSRAEGVRGASADYRIDETELFNLHALLRVVAAEPSALPPPPPCAASACSALSAAAASSSSASNSTTSSSDSHSRQTRQALKQKASRQPGS